MTQTLEFVTPDNCFTIEAEIETGLDNQAVWIDANTFNKTTGWTLKSEGFCQDEICIPARDSVNQDGNIDLARFAALTGRPWITDIDAGIVSLGSTFEARGDALNSLEAPDFELPDITGQMHRLSDYRGKKVLLAAYASW